MSVTPSSVVFSTPFGVTPTISSSIMSVAPLGVTSTTSSDITSVISSNIKPVSLAFVDAALL
ncbi:17104_t:CDS:1, partial [Racocetra persica]